MAISWFAPAVAASATEFFVFDQSAITKVFSGIGKSPCVDDTGNDLDSSDRTDTRELLLEAHEAVSSGTVTESAFVLVFTLAVEIDIFREKPTDERSGFACVSVCELEGRLLVQETNPGAHDIVIGADQQPELIQATGTVIDFCEKFGPEQLTQFACIDLVGLRAMLEELIFEWIADDDPVHLIEELQVQPVCEP